MPEAALISATAMVTAGVGAKVSANMPAAKLTKLLAATMLLAVPAILLKPTRARAEPGGASEIAPTENGSQLELTYYLGRGAPKSVDALKPWFLENYSYLFLGSLVGFSSALLGIGGGILDKCMSTVYDMSQHEAVATSLVAMVPTVLLDTSSEKECAWPRCLVYWDPVHSPWLEPLSFCADVSESDMRKIFAAVLAFHQPMLM